MATAAAAANIRLASGKAPETLLPTAAKPLPLSAVRLLPALGLMKNCPPPSTRSQCRSGTIAIRKRPIAMSTACDGSTSSVRAPSAAAGMPVTE